MKLVIRDGKKVLKITFDRKQSGHVMLSPDAGMNTVNTYHFVCCWIHALAYGTTVYGRIPPLEAVEGQLNLSTGQADENEIIAARQ